MAVANPCIVEAHGFWLSTVLAATSSIGGRGAAAMPIEEAGEVGAEVKGYARRDKAEG